jgi:hypothetical protein
MMRVFVKMSAAGLIDAMAQAPDNWQGDIADLGDGFVELVPPPPMPFNPSAWWWSGTEWQERLALPEPVITEAAEELHYAWSELPEGTVVTVEDGETGQVLGTEAEIGGAIAVELHDAGPYRLTVTGPAEWLAQEIEVVL